VAAPNLTEWRRQTVGDLTSAFNFAAAPDASIPSIPGSLEDSLLSAPQEAECLVEEGLQSPNATPSATGVPAQEAGTRPSPSGLSASC
jgi:phospholipase C